MVIQIINPNTNKLMTAGIENAIRSKMENDTDLVFTTTVDGPDTIESAFDECIAACAVLECVKKGSSSGYAGHIIACFGDPGLDASRELVDAPVIGIAEASMHMASFIATKFSIVTTVTRMKTHTENLVYKYGYERKCSNVRTIDSPVSSLIDETCVAASLVESECRVAIERDNIGAIILGCAGMTGLASDLTSRLGIPIIDGVAAGIYIAEALIKGKISTSKFGDYAIPPKKEYRGTYKKWREEYDKH